MDPNLLMQQPGFDLSQQQGTNNQQILLDNGFVGVADCGQKVYEWKAEK